MNGCAEYNFSQPIGGNLLQQSSVHFTVSHLSPPILHLLNYLHVLQIHEVRFYVSILLLKILLAVINYLCLPSLSLVIDISPKFLFPHLDNILFSHH